MKKAIIIFCLISFGCFAQSNKQPYQSALEKTKEKSFTLYENQKGGLIAKDSAGYQLLLFIQNLQLQLEEQKRLKESYRDNK